jgi:predicted enzyme related to lactoylglutathione lyase
MRRVTGIGGIVFKARDPAALQAWYRTHLGMDVQAWGGAALDWNDDDGKPVAGTTAWRVCADGEDFGPGKPSFMVTYRVDDLAALLEAMRSDGCTVLDKIDESEYGKFGWAVDPEGNKVELWEPPEGQ